MTTGSSGGRAGHEHDRDDVDKDVSGSEPVERDGDYTDTDVAADVPTVEREGDYTDTDLAADVPTGEREGEYTDKDVDEGDTDPPTGSYTDRDVTR